MPCPTWDMMRATKPFEYIHSDWMDMPTAATGEKYLMIIIDDLSGTTLLHPAKTHTALQTAKVFTNEWLSTYPDPTILHTDGGTHYKNSIFKAIADIRGYKHHITAPYAKQSHGVGERINRRCLDSFLALLGQLEADEKEWTKFAKLVQAQINRTRTKSRGNKSPIEITTGITTPTTFEHILYEGIDEPGIAKALPLDSTLIQNHIDDFIKGLDATWGQTARARNKKADKNRKQQYKRKKPKTKEHLPLINIGDYVLVAIPVRPSKLQFKWVGPVQVIDTVSDFVYTCKPISKRKLKPRNVHITRLRRFAGKNLQITEQIQAAIDRDFPDNEVQQIIDHKTNKADGELHLLVQWLGFTKAERTWEPARSLHEYVPGHVRAYTHDHKQHAGCQKFYNDHYD